METINTVVGRYSSPSFVVGCKEPLTFQDFSEMDFHLSGEFLKKNLVCEVDVCVLVPSAPLCPCLLDIFSSLALTRLVVKLYRNIPI